MRLDLKNRICGFYNRKTRLLVLLLLGVIVFVTYLPALFNNFLLRWDDQWVVINHYTFDGFTPSNLWRILTEFYHGQYSPVNQLYYTFLYSIAELNPFVFHLGSLLLHYINVVLVYYFFSKLLLLSGSFDKSSSHFAGFVTALLLAVHPFNVEAVAWLSASKVVLYAVFYFSALTAYMHYINSGKLKYYCFSLCLFIVSFGAKEQAVVLSISVVLMDCVLNRNLKDKKIWLEKLPFFIFSIFGGLLTIQSQVKGLDEVSYHISQRIVFAAYTLTEYFTKCVAPVKLSYLYPFSSQPWEVMPLKLMIYPVAICILTILLIKFRIQKYRWPCFLLLFFVANLAVALHIISLSRFAIVADRYVYVASAAVFLGIGMLCLQLIKRYPKYRKLIIICLGIYIISLGVYAHQRTKVWLDTDSLKKELREQIQKRMTSGFPVQNNNIIITI